MFDLDSNIETYILQLENINHKKLLMKFDNKYTVSNNGNFVVLSNPKYKQIYVFKNNSHSEFKYKLVRIINMVGYWPVLSPKNRYLAFQVATENKQYPSKLGKFYYPSIIIYDIVNNKPIFAMKFKEYDPLSFFMYDWIK